VLAADISLSKIDADNGAALTKYERARILGACALQIRYVSISVYNTIG
jgi:DNA-directed RNA polymerase subunit K/omega